VTTLVGRDELAAGLAAGRVTVVDALPAAYWAQQHLPGALNIVEHDVDRLAPELLPDTTARIVVYCSNAACGNSRAVAERLEVLGYTRVRTYADGIQDWVEAGLPVEPGPGR
jgi:rhodanese-related sulfurtransferase